jgi:dihydrofolate reductase
MLSGGGAMREFKFSPRGENRMNKVTCGITMSLDAFVAGLNQSAEKPFGDIDETILHGWMFEEPEKHQAQLNALMDAGAFIMGSNMYGPKEKRESPDWKGWPQWGDNPPYHAPVFVLSHKRRDPIAMEGGTTYIFIADGIEAALSAAKEAAGQRNVAIMGGANTINQCLSAGLVDELWLHIAPVTCGAGARLFENVPNLQLEPLEISGTPLVTHIRYRVIKK